MDKRVLTLDFASAGMLHNADYIIKDGKKIYNH